MTLRVLDLFSGIGGFSLGLERTGGFETVAFCEIEEYPRKVLAKHWPEVPCYHDVREVTKELLDRDGIAVDVITGGFPCQDLSVAGKLAGIEGERSGLWSEIVRLIGELRPRYVIVENVANLLRGPFEQPGGWFSTVLRDLAECGYDAEWENIPASALGACHRRERVWIVGYPCKNGLQEHGRLAVNDELRNIALQYREAGLATNAKCKRQQGQGRTKGQLNQAPKKDWQANFSKHALRWPTQPPICGRNDGLSRRMDQSRIAALGNAVVPQIPELIGYGILEAEA